MARGQSKTPAEKAREAVEEQEKVVSRLGTQIEKLEKSVEDAQAELEKAKPTFEFERDMLAVLRRHPALGQADTLPVNLGDTEEQVLPEALQAEVNAAPVVVRDATYDSRTGQVTDDEPQFQHGVDETVGTERVDSEGHRRTGLTSATPVVDETPDPTETAVAPQRVLGSTGRNPWDL